MHVDRKPYEMAHHVAVMIAASLVPRHSSGYIHEASEIACYKWPFYVRGYHGYKSTWSLTIYRRNAEASYGAYQSTRLLCCGCNKSWLCSGTGFKDSQLENFLFLGKVRSVGSCEVTGVMVGHADKFLA